MNVFNLISAGGGSGSGLYIWKKSKATPMLYIAHSLPASNNLIDAYLPASIVYHVLEGDTVTAHADGTVTVDNPTIITIDGNTSETTYYLKYGKYYSIAESTTGEVFVSTLQSDTRVFLSWSNNNYKLFVQGGISTTYPINYYASKNELEFIDYVVSDKEDAYPDGGEQGGFYYEKFAPLSAESFGGENVEVGSYTAASERSSNFKINHSFGVIPKVVLWVAENTKTTGQLGFMGVYRSDGYMAINGLYASGTAGFQANGTAGGASATQFTVLIPNNTSGYLIAGETYHYILIT